MGGPVDGIGPPPGLLNSLTNRLGADASQLFVSLLNQGFSVNEALARTFNPDHNNGNRSSVDTNALAQVYDSLPEDVQQRIVQGADALPPPIREALDELGITQPQQHDHGVENAANQQAARGADGNAPSALRDGSGTLRGDAVTMANSAAQTLQGGHVQGGTPTTGQAGNASAAQEATPLAAAFSKQQVAQAQQAGRALGDVQLPQQAGRAPDGFAASRAQDPGNAVVMPERMNPAQQQPMQAQTQNAPLVQGRTDAMAAQVLPMLAGATMLANPQGVPMPSQATAPVPPGTDTAAAQARESRLAPAGHTLAGSLRRDLRKGLVPLRDRPMDWALALIAARRRRREEQEDPASSFQWVFWVFTVVAYGALAIAVIAMIPNGGALTNGLGRPSAAGYALIIGAIAALASWLVGRRVAKS